MSAILKSPLLQMRPMRESDIDEVMEVEAAAYAFPWTPGIFRDCLRVGYCCWVCILDERIIGYSIMSVVLDESHILNLCVHPEMWRQGLGRRLLEQTQGLARQHGADTIFLEVRASNGSAVALYESMGFNEVGVRHNYYPANRGREDALILACSL